jgi:hypothetical protein
MHLTSGALTPIPEPPTVVPLVSVLAAGAFFRRKAPSSKSK